MDQTIAKALRKAYEYVKVGNKESARPIVVEILKREPELEQAWILLSLVVDDEKRQVYALRQALRINPSNGKALGRLEKITGTPYQAVSKTSRSSSETSSLVEQPVADAQDEYRTDEANEGLSGDDLLNQRLFGDDSEISEESAETDVDNDVEEYSSEGEEYSSFRDEEYQKEAEPQEKKKRAWLRPALLIVLVIVLAGGSYYLFSQGYFGKESVAEDSSSLILEETEVMEEPTLLPTATLAGLGLPPTWTPGPVVSPTLPPTATMTPFPLPTVATVILAPEVEDAVLNTQRQVAELREIEIADEIKAPIVITQIRAEEILRTHIAALGIDDLVDRHLYEVLGLMRPDQNLDNYYLNLYLDPLGGIYLPGTDEIYLIGLGFGARESYVYAQQYVHYLMDSEHDFEGLGYDPGCIWSPEQCTAIRAFIEGDAAVVRDAWLDEYVANGEAAALSELSKTYRVLTSGSMPAFALADLAFYYEQGPAFVEALVEANGYESLSAVYLNPPMTTEQILHPEKFMDGEFELFIDDARLSDVLDEDWEEESNGSFGEWMTQLILSQSLDALARLDITDAEDAAAGWGGDFYQLYINASSGESLLGVHWQWDTVEEAEEFYSYLSIYMSGRFADGFPEASVEAACFGEELLSCAVQIDEHVYWVVGENLSEVELITQFYIDSTPLVE